MNVGIVRLNVVNTVIEARIWPARVSAETTPRANPSTTARPIATTISKRVLHDYPLRDNHFNGTIDWVEIAVDADPGSAHPDIGVDRSRISMLEQ